MTPLDYIINCACQGCEQYCPSRSIVGSFRIVKRADMAPRVRRTAQQIEEELAEQGIFREWVDAEQAYRYVCHACDVRFPVAREARAHLAAAHQQLDSDSDIASDDGDLSGDGSAPSSAAVSSVDGAGERSASDAGGTEGEQGSDQEVNLPDALPLQPGPAPVIPNLWLVDPNAAIPVVLPPIAEHEALELHAVAAAEAVGIGIQQVRCS